MGMRICQKATTVIDTVDSKAALDLGATVDSTSVITLKPAIRYQFKTGQRDWPKT
jgi:hypothetical protein